VNNFFFSLGFFAARGLCPANKAEPRAAKSCPTAFALAPASGKYCYALATLQATIVLPAFARSGAAEREKKGKKIQ
jgi:hypothetical protein